MAVSNFLKNQRWLCIALAAVIAFTGGCAPSGTVTEPASTQLFTPFAREIHLGNVEIRNIIFMVPDGMDANGVTLARWLKAFDPQTGHVDLSVRLNMDELISGMIRSYWTDGYIVGGITDSAPAATAMATGRLTNNRFVGVMPDGVPVANILQAARHLGKSTGLIATSNIQHATPAGFSAHHVERNRYDIIGEQQVYGNIDVVFSAGSQFMTPPFRRDGENLIERLVERGYQFITTRDEMMGLTEGRVWGLFAPHFLIDNINRQRLMPSQPSLAEMTGKAIELLSQNENGFFLMVEGSKIDWAAHGNEPVSLMSEIFAFDEAVGVALDFARECGYTMIIIASDHGTGGITMGDRATTSTYHSDPVSRFVAPLARATLSFEGIHFTINENRSNTASLVYTHMGIGDLTSDELEALTAATGYVAFRDTMGPIISRRANLGWTSGGHVGNDPVLYSFLPGNQRIVGLFSLTDLTRIMEMAWDVDLAELTSLLFNDALQAFEQRGATVEIDAEIPSSVFMTVTRGTDTLVIPENKDYVYFNGSRVYFSINVFSAGTFFVNQGALGLLP
ncbi:MAG: alkaline phosphatase [Treponema sp.]|nr:alkaline phosphatase [Treponema sp.]